MEYGFIPDKGNQWSEQIPLPSTINTEAQEANAILTAKSNLYFTRNSNIMVSECREGEFSEPKFLESINTTCRNSFFYIDP